MIVTFWSAWPGQGVTTLAGGVAAVLSKAYSTVLLDLHAEWPQQWALFHVDGEQHLEKLNLYSGILTMDYVEPILARRGTLDLVPGFFHPEEAKTEVTSRTLAELIRLLDDRYDMVVIDGGNRIRDAGAWNAARMAHQLILTLFPQYGPAREWVRFAQMGYVGLPSPQLVLNRIPKKLDVPVREVASFVDAPLLATIPEVTAELWNAINRGGFYEWARKQTAFRQLAEAIVNLK